MRDRLTEFGDSTSVAIVTFTNPENLAHYQQKHELPFPVLSDVDRAAYQAYGLERGSVLRVWGFKAVRRYLQIMRASGVSNLGVPTEDTLQLGGDFVVAPDGTLAYRFWGDGPDDRPSVDDLIAAVESCATA